MEELVNLYYVLKYCTVHYFISRIKNRNENAQIKAKAKNKDKYLGKIESIVSARYGEQ